MSQQLDEIASEERESTVEIFPFEERKGRVLWEKVAGALEDTYHEPDLEAVRIMAAAGAAHHMYPDSNPVWLMLIGPSGSGKTSQVGPVMNCLPDVVQISNLTEKTLLSGWSRGEAKTSGLLSKLGKSIVIWISDFSSISSMGADKRGELGSQFREIYDGHIKKNWGTGSEEEWQGKATMLIGATREAEKAWALMRALGERFLYVRWRVGDPEQMALMAGVQDDREETRETVQRYVRDWFEGVVGTKVDERLNFKEIEATGLHKVASFVARMRQGVERDRQGNITDVGQAEGPTRIMTACWLTAKAHSRLMRRTRVGREDMRVAMRIAQDTLPGLRASTLEGLRDALRGKSVEAVGTADVQREISRGGNGSISQAAITKRLEDLAAIKVISKEESGGSLWWRVDDWAEERIRIIEEALK